MSMQTKNFDSNCIYVDVIVWFKKIFFPGYTAAGTPYKVSPTQSNGAPPPYTPTPTPYPTAMYPIRSAYPQQNLYTQVRVLQKNTWNTWSKLFVLWMIKHIQIFSYWDKIPILMWLPWVSLFVPYWLKSKFLAYSSPGRILSPTGVCSSATCDPSHHCGATKQHPIHSPLPSPRPCTLSSKQWHGCHGDGRRDNHGHECRWAHALRHMYMFTTSRISFFSSALANHLKQI